QGRPRAPVELVVVGNDVVADFDALVANEDGRSRDELADVVLILVAERAPQYFRLAGLFSRHQSFPRPLYRLPAGRAIAGGSHHALRVSTSSMIPYSFA